MVKYQIPCLFELRIFRCMQGTDFPRQRNTGRPREGGNINGAAIVAPDRKLSSKASSYSPGGHVERNSDPPLSTSLLAAKCARRYRGFGLFRFISCGGEEFRAFLWREGRQQRADPVPQAVDRSLGSFARMGLEFGEGVFDRLEVGAVGREIEK